MYYKVYEKEINKKIVKDFGKIDKANIVSGRRGGRQAPPSPEY
jgi:hypothetical protein